MRFEEVSVRRPRWACTRAAAAAILGISARTYRRWRGREAPEEAGDAGSADRPSVAVRGRLLTALARAGITERTTATTSLATRFFSAFTHRGAGPAHEVGLACIPWIGTPFAEEGQHIETGRAYQGALAWLTDRTVRRSSSRDHRCAQQFRRAADRCDRTNRTDPGRHTPDT